MNETNGLPVLWIVVPCYNEEEALPESNERLKALLRQMISDASVSAESRIVYVNDGSRDDTWQIISKAHHDDGIVAGINLACNVGHQNALLAGLSVAAEHADAVVSIDADLQDDINVIKDMVSLYAQGNDIVYGVRRNRTTDTWFKRNSALLFYNIMKWLGVRSVYNHADFRLMSKRAVCQLLRYRETNLFLRGMVPLVGYRSQCVYYDRAERQAGESKYPLMKMINFAIDGITSFSVKPVRMVFNLGVLFLAASFVVFLYSIFRYITGNVITGWTSLMLSVWFASGCILVSLGIIGEYVGKTYIEVKDRPRYNIEEVIL